MKYYLLAGIGLAVLGVSFLREPARGGEAVCGANSGVNTPRECCPHCGCRLVPVCQIYYTTKKVTEYKYRGVCEEICVPGVTPRSERLAGCRAPAQCGGAPCPDGCRECCAGRCMVREVQKVAKYPVTREVPVRKCTVEWVCPACSAGPRSR
jgi:hypothetical protein